MENVFRTQIPERGKNQFDTLRVTSEIAQQCGEVKYRYRKRGKPRDLMIKVPVGIKNGRTIRLREMGSPGKAGGTPVDLLLKVSIKVPLSQRIQSFFKI